MAIASLKQFQKNIDESVWLNPIETKLQKIVYNSAPVIHV